MKKIFLLMSIAFISLAITSCECSKDNKLSTPEFLYSLEATAEGEVAFSWFNGGAAINGNAKVFQSNDTTATPVFTAKVCNIAPKLSEGLNSNDPEISEAAQICSSRLQLQVNGIEGNYQLGIVGYVAYGKIVFAIDEHWPPIN